MHFFDAAAVDAALAYPALVDVLEAAFRQGAIAPLRHHHAVPLEGRPEATLLLMPAWEANAPGSPNAGRYLGVKSVSVFPDNATLGKPAVFGTYLLMSARTGETLSVMDATRLTAWRTGAASALASRHLARPDASRLAMIGAGALAPHLIRAHAAVRPIREVVIWNRSAPRARALADSLADTSLTVAIAADIERAVRGADIVSAATLSAEPLIRGAWLSPGTHVDCAGAFSEAGDILQPLEAGVIGKDAVLGDLFELCRGTVAGRASASEITFFKSVGAAIEDLAAAIAVYETGGQTLRA
jgi:ornithine cyclodeaminase